MHEAIERIAKYVAKTGAYDYVDDSVEIRLHGQARDIFTATIEVGEPEHDCKLDSHVYAADQVCNGEPIKGSVCCECGDVYGRKG